MFKMAKQFDLVKEQFWNIKKKMCNEIKCPIKQNLPRVRVCYTLPPDKSPSDIFHKNSGKIIIQGDQKQTCDK